MRVLSLYLYIIIIIIIIIIKRQIMSDYLSIFS